VYNLNKVLEDYLRTIKQPPEKMKEVSVLNEELRTQINKKNFERVAELNMKIKVALNSTLKVR